MAVQLAGIKGVKSLRKFIIVLIVCILGCEEEQQSLPDFIWEGEKIRFATNGELPLPEGTFVKFEKVVSDLETRLNVEIPEGKTIDYYHLLGYQWEDFCTSSKDLISGCTTEDGTIYYFMPDIINVHELVHGVLVLTLGDSHSVFEEGAAEFFSHRPFYDDSDSPPAETRIQILKESIFSDAAPADVDYEAAGYFVGYLVNIYGLEVVKELYQQSSYSSSQEDISILLEALTGDSLDVILNDMTTTMPECYVENSCFFSHEISWSGDTWVYDYDISATGVDVYAENMQSYENGFVVVSSLIDIPSSGTYEIAFLSDSSVITNMTPDFMQCTETYLTIDDMYSSYSYIPESDDFVQHEDGEFKKVFTFSFDPGIYEMRISLFFSTGIDAFLNTSNFLNVSVTIID